MNNSDANFAALESHEARKKRLGQYLSGLPVSKLLVALAARRGIRSVCDPMGGDVATCSSRLARSFLNARVPVAQSEYSPVHSASGAGRLEAPRDVFVEGRENSLESHALALLQILLPQRLRCLCGLEDGIFGIPPAKLVLRHFVRIDVLAFLHLRFCMLPDDFLRHGCLSRPIGASNNQ